MEKLSHKFLRVSFVYIMLKNVFVKAFNLVQLLENYCSFWCKDSPVHLGICSLWWKLQRNNTILFIRC